MAVAFQVIDDLKSAGVTISREGDMIVLDGPEAAMTEAVLASLRSLKPQIISYLRDTADGEAQENWQAFNNKQFGVTARDSELSGLDPQDSTHERHVIEWLNQHCEPSAPDQCAWCKQSDSPEHIIVPFGSNLHGHTWLHPECWREWHKLRRETATQALLAKEIHGPYVELREPEVQMPRADSEMAAAGRFHSPRLIPRSTSANFPSAPPTAPAAAAQGSRNRAMT